MSERSPAAKPGCSPFYTMSTEDKSLRPWSRSHNEERGNTKLPLGVTVNCSLQTEAELLLLFSLFSSDQQKHPERFQSNTNYLFWRARISEARLTSEILGFCLSTVMIQRTKDGTQEMELRTRTPAGQVPEQFKDLFLNQDTLG
ncbi:unnamed protein product [Pleuronectes platessa]|uniref:Uncharacterized protein n=1 Tax=Pleuronectes platessa TaxID=8262 RepID=A0A9N7VNV5_PLEPL|nr:unnamed protein product [Pleuronectes platessa]